MSEEVQDQAALMGSVISAHMKHMHPDGKPDPEGCITCEFFQLGVPQPKLEWRIIMLDMSKSKV